jgi:hypothetical protein
MNANGTTPPPPVWMVWANPVFRRYCRSRLRPRALGLSLLLALLLGGFLFALPRTIGIHEGGLDLVDAERLPLIPLLFLQGLILFFLGTGQAAGGMTAEADEGVLDYQRLAPMSPLAKVLGYLFGLPVREWVAFLATVPFSAWSLWRGQVPFLVAVQLYGVLVSSAVLYHLTGLVCGTVVKNRRWAFLASMGVVFVLYTVVPQLAKFGLVYFKYLTLWPVFDECLPYLIPREVGADLRAAMAFFADARFFGLDLPEAVFCLLSQAVVSFTFVVMLWRRWRRAESHLLGKAWAVGLFAWVQVLLLGNALPLIDLGRIFPSREFAQRFGFMRFVRRSWHDWAPEAGEAVVMAGVFGLVSLCLLWVLTAMITPTADGQLRGWRRAYKHGESSLRPLSDPATAFWSVLAMALAGTVGWTVFARAVYESHWFPGHEMPWFAPLAFALVFLVGGLGFHALLEAWGSRVVLLAAVLGGALPVMLGTVVMAVANQVAYPSAVWLIGISPVSAPFFAAGSVLPVTGFYPRDLERAMPRAFWFWLAVGTLLAAWLVVRLWQSRAAIAAEAKVRRPAAAAPSTAGVEVAGAAPVTGRDTGT